MLAQVGATRPKDAGRAQNRTRNGLLSHKPLAVSAYSLRWSQQVSAEHADPRCPGAVGRATGWGRSLLSMARPHRQNARTRTRVWAAGWSTRCNCGNMASRC